MPISNRLHTWFEVRGIESSDDDEFQRLAPWFRTTFILCTTFMAIGTALASTPILLAMVVIAGLGGIFHRHPFDYVYNYGVRRLTRTRMLPTNNAPTRFACGLASVWLIAMVIAFEAGAAWLGYALGVGIVAVAGLVAVTDFCIPSMIYQTLFGDRSLVKRALTGNK